MGEFALHSFCKGCGGHKRRMPFGQSSSFFDSAPCGRCGDSRTGRQTVARNTQVGRWPWQRGWVDREGCRSDVIQEPPHDH